MRKVLAIFMFLTAGVTFAQDGELPAGANAKPVEVDTRCTIVVGGETVDCYYDPDSGKWTPGGITDNPAIGNCLDAAAAGIYNADKIAEQFNKLLDEFKNEKDLTDAEIKALNENYDAIMEKLKDLSNVEVNECDLCNLETKEFNSITIDDKGGYRLGKTSSSGGCNEAAEKLADNIVSMGQSIAADRKRLTDAEKRLADAETTLVDHGSRISTLEGKDWATMASVNAIYTWGLGEHDRLLRKIGGVRDDLNAHIKNCNGDGDGTNTIEFATCDLCSNTNGVEIADLTFVKHEQAVGDKPAVPAHIESPKSTVTGCDDAIKQVGDNVGELVTAVGTVLYLPERVETHIEWAEQDSAKQWEEISKNAFKESTYQGSISSLAEALDPSNNKTVGGKVMFQPSASSTNNYFTLEVGKLSYPPCEGVSSNEVEDIVKNYIDSEGGGCTCTPDEYIKEETDPIWQEEKSSYATLQDLEEVNDILGSLIEQMQLEIEKLEGDIAIVQHMAETTITATRHLDERLMALESLTNNITGGN